MKVKKYPVFDNPKQATYYNPYIIDFAIGKDAVGHIVLNSDAIEAIIKEFTK